MKLPPVDAIEELEVLQAGNEFRAAITLGLYRKKRVVLKDFRESSRGFRNCCGRLLAGREANAFKKMKGLEGIPSFLSRYESDGLLLEFVDAPNSLSISGSTVEPSFFGRLQTLLDRILDRGVVHLDVSRNILVYQNSIPFLVDFQSAILIPGWLPLQRWLLGPIRKRYGREVLRIKNRLRPDLMTPEDKSAIHIRFPSDRLWRFCVIFVRSWSSLVVFLLTGKWVRWSSLR
jgi:hypothetical protein